MFSLKLFVVLIAIALCKCEGDLASFESSGVVPDVIATAPQQLLKVTYDNNVTLELASELTPTQVKNQPSVEYEADNDAFYTLILTDPDAPSRAEPKIREFKHWVLVNIPGNNIEDGEALAEYVGSGPPKDTGLHRYVFLLYKQPRKLEFDEKRVANNSREGRLNFSAANFAKKYDLGNPIAGNFYEAQYDDYVPILHKQLA